MSLSHRFLLLLLFFRFRLSRGNKVTLLHDFVVETKVKNDDLQGIKVSKNGVILFEANS